MGFKFRKFVKQKIKNSKLNVKPKFIFGSKYNNIVASYDPLKNKILINKRIILRDYEFVKDKYDFEEYLDMVVSHELGHVADKEISCYTGIDQLFAWSSIFEEKILEDALKEFDKYSESIINIEKRANKLGMQYTNYPDKFNEFTQDKLKLYHKRLELDKKAIWRYYVNHYWI